MIALAPRLALSILAGERDALGRIGEELAARHLAARGWRILGRRVATRAAELDLVAERAGLTAVVEVKAGRIPADLLRAHRSGLGPDLRFRPGHRLDQRRLRRLRRAARELARGRRVRVDLIEVLVTERGRAPLLVHHEDLRRPLP